MEIAGKAYCAPYLTRKEATPGGIKFMRKAARSCLKIATRSSVLPLSIERRMMAQWLHFLHRIQELINPQKFAGTNAAEMAPHLALGRRGESLAAAHLERAGYRLVASNFELPVGRNLRGALVHAEIDIVAYDGATLCFVEVKTRASDWFAAPEANVDLVSSGRSRAPRASTAYLWTYNAHVATTWVVWFCLPLVGRRRATTAPRVAAEFSGRRVIS